MRFARHDLIRRVRDEIQRRTEVTAQTNAESAERAARTRNEYVTRTSEDWKRFADRIQTAVGEGRPVTSEDVPEQLRDGWGDRLIVNRADYWAPPTPRVPDIAALSALLALLEAATDDEISTGSLERSGFRVGALFRR